MRIKRYVLLAALGMLAGYEVWRRSSRGLPDQPVAPRLADVSSFGSDAGQGNLLAVQPFMTPLDYATPERFQARLRAYLVEAQKRGWITSRTIVVFPEHLGTWLAALQEKRTVYQATSVAAALRVVALCHLPSVAWRVPLAPAADRAAYAVFATKAEAMADAYHQTFSNLARTFGCTIVAGSIVLPMPEVENGRLVVHPGPLQNVTAVYGPEGEPHPQLVRKIHLTPAEQPFAVGALPAELPCFDTPAGRLGVLICADSWYPEPYEILRRHQVDLIAVPSYLEVDGIWERPWRGYAGMIAPDDVDPADVGRLTEGQAWLRYALAGRIQGGGARYGINVFLRGALWDLGSDGHTIAVDHGRALEARHVDGAALVNLWLA
ncbi:MAG: carbon-nitrogen hydrolase [Anaerolineae bacterium]